MSTDLKQQDALAEGHDGGDAQTADAGAADNTGAQATAGSADAGKLLLTQEQFDKSLQARLARQQKAADEKLAALQAEIAARDAELEKHRQAALSEEDRRKEEHEAALRRADEAERKLQAAQAETVRLQIITTKAPTLPVAYRALVAGDTAEAVEASLAEVLAQYQADNAGKLDAVTLRAAKSLTAEERVEKYGAEMAAALNEVLQPPAQSVGSPSNQGAAPPIGGSGASLRDVAQLPGGPQRENALVAALAGK